MRELGLGCRCANHWPLTESPSLGPDLDRGTCRTRREQAAARVTVYSSPVHWQVVQVPRPGWKCSASLNRPHDAMPVIPCHPSRFVPGSDEPEPESSSVKCRRPRADARAVAAATVPVGMTHSLAGFKFRLAAWRPDSDARAGPGAGPHWHGGSRGGGRRTSLRPGSRSQLTESGHAGVTSHESESPSPRGSESRPRPPVTQAVTSS